MKAWQMHAPGSAAERIIDGQFVQRSAICPFLCHFLCHFLPARLLNWKARHASIEITPLPDPNSTPARVHLLGQVLLHVDEDEQEFVLDGE